MKICINQDLLPTRKSGVGLFIILVENILSTDRHVPALADSVVATPDLGVAADSLWRREGCIAVGIYTLVLQDTGCTRRGVAGVHHLAYAPSAVEEVHDVLDVGAHLQGVLALADVELEVMLEADVNTMYPRIVDTVTLGILTLVAAQVVILVHIVHEAIAVVVTDETEQTVLHLRVGWDVESIVVVTVTVHVVDSEVRVVEATTIGLVDDAVVVVSLVVDGSRKDETVWSQVVGIVQLDVVRTFGSRHIGECRLSSRTRHRGQLLLGSVRVSSHEVDPLGWLGVQLEAGRPTITLAGVLQHEGLGVGAIAGRIDRTVVHTVEAGETTYVRNRPVADAYVVDGLVEDTLGSDAHWELEWQTVVNSERGLPYLWKLEVWIDSRDGRWNGTILWRNC